jgi:60 kDa SS-A/Ro ribonucleoprotein
MRTNLKTKTAKVYTHEGAPAVGRLSPIEMLKRSLLSCFLWENEFYEDGVSIAERIRSIAAKCDPSEVAALAVCARNVHGLRHAPLLLLEVLSRTGAGRPGLVSGAIAGTISRADELSEFVSLYMKLGGKTLSGQVKKGLATAFHSFDEYQLAKYDRDGAYRLRDVLFLCHAKPKDDEQKALWGRLIDGTLKVPDTWEVALSGGADKEEAFTRLLTDGKLGYLALLRNLRNMEQSGVDRALVERAIVARKGAGKVLPFRYVAAARAAPNLEPAIDTALCAAVKELPKLTGLTGVLVDVSGSMDHALSGKSDMKRIDAAAALASVINAEQLVVGTFSARLVMVPPRRGMAGVDTVISSQPHVGTMLGASLTEFLRKNPGLDRLIVITDEQSHDPIPTFLKSDGLKRYLINVMSAQNGVGYRNGWVHIDGFSEGVLRYIHNVESPKVFDAVEAVPDTMERARVEREVAKANTKTKTKAKPETKTKKTARKRTGAQSRSR